MSYYRPLYQGPKTVRGLRIDRFCCERHAWSEIERPDIKTHYSYINRVSQSHTDLF